MINSKFIWDKLVDFVVGDFNGKSFYDFEDEPYAFNITTPGIYAI